MAKSKTKSQDIQDWAVHQKSVFYRPSRASYVRKQRPVRGCVFCQSLTQGQTPKSLVVYRDALAMVVINKFPYNSGHVLILPARHVGEMTELQDLEVIHLARLLNETVRILKKAYSPMGLNVGLNLGSAAGAGIPGHLHYHVIPRWNGDTNFFPLIARTKVVIERPEKSFQRLRKEFRLLKWEGL